jgi:hypothetical protein
MSLFVFGKGPLGSIETETKKPVTTNRKLLFMAVVLFVFSSFAFSSTVAVGTCTNFPYYSSIQLAVNSVPAGSTIKVCPGVYAEQVLITKNLTLTGVAANGLSGAAAAGMNNPVITSPSGGVLANANDLYNSFPIAAQIAVVTPAGASSPIKVTIEYLAVDGSNNQLSGCGTNLVGIYYQNASGTVNQVVTRNQELDPSDFGCQDGLAIFVESGYGSGGSAVVTIENSSVHDYDKNGITVDGSGTVATVTGNYVVGVGATALTAQNGIQVSDGAAGSVKNNTVTDDVYINPPDCGTSCYGSSGILVYDSGATSGSPLTISGNTISNTQLAIFAYGDSSGKADYNNVSSNRITGTLAAGTFLDDGIDLCSNNNTATSNTVFNSSGSGIHIDSSCTQSTGSSGNNTVVTKNRINEACAGVLNGSGTGSSQSGNITYNVVLTSLPGDSCPTGSPNADVSTRKAAKRRPLPLRH